jgi:hydroxymethylpyrimidine kinase/phosphomethylpyrimidine kinase
MDSFLTIAASDNSGGAGIQKDLRVAHDLGYQGLSAVTGITVQDFSTVFQFEAVNPNLLKAQIECCLRSFPVKAIKIGAICSNGNLLVIADCLKQNTHPHIILDPVLASTSGASFLGKESLKLLTTKLLPLTELITPNKNEFEILTDKKFETIEEAIEIAKVKCEAWGTSILLKGGHFDDSKIKEALITKSGTFLFERARKKFKNGHGTGCTLSSALACYLGNGKSLVDAYLLASQYVLNIYDDNE